MSKAFNFGKRLTEDEYQKAITDLYQKPPLSISAEAWEQKVRRREFDLTIDHRLGLNFPEDRRNELWKIQEKIDKQRYYLTFKYLFRKIFAKQIVRDVQGLAGVLVDEYAKILTPEELQQYFGLRPGERPVLPIDDKQLK